VSASEISLGWHDNSSNESGFHVERATNANGPFTRIFSTTANAASYTNPNLAEATTYYYRVQSFNGGGASSYSNIAYATTLSSQGQPISDTEPPQLISFSFSPAAIDVTNAAQIVTVEARVKDNVSGTASVTVQFRSPSGTQLMPLNSAFLPRVSGTALDGIYRGIVSIPPFVQAGTWSVNTASLQDSAGNLVTLNTANLASLAFPTELNVVSIQDTTAPTVTHIFFPVTSIDVSAGAQPLAIEFTIDDDISGVDLTSTVFLEFRVTLTSPSSGQFQFMSRPQFTRVSGTNLSGVWRGTTTIPQFSEPGLWGISSLQLIDFAGNRRAYSASQLQSLGIATQFMVASVPGDIAKPTVTAMSFAPAVIDTSGGSQTVTVTLTIADDLAGVSFAIDNPNASFAHGITFVSPSGSQSRGQSNTGFTRTAGTALNGVWTGTVVFPRFSEAGTWRATLNNIKDAANNGVLNGNYSTAQLAAMGFVTDLTVFRPSGDTDATIPPGGGTATDAVFGNRASITFPPGILQANTGVAIDVLSGTNPLGLPTPAGVTAGTLFVNIALTPTPPMPFHAPGLTVVLPFSVFRTPGTPISLYRLDPLLGTLIPAINVSGGTITGTVNTDGLSATFLGVSHLSTLVAFVPVSMLGDVDGDDVVSCADLVIVRAAYGARTGQARFDIRADMNRNGVIDISDLALVSRQLPAGTVCAP
jgi:alpha-acetolactate decarboxylase